MHIGVLVICVFIIFSVLLFQIVQNNNKFRKLGPVVQSIVSLTTSLRHKLVKYMLTKLSNTLLFFVGKM